MIAAVKASRASVARMGVLRLSETLMQTATKRFPRVAEHGDFCLESAN
jgi:hypothetical protein